MSRKRGKPRRCTGPTRNKELALQCYREWLDGKTVVEIGRRRGWAIQRGSSDEKERWCSTAKRYISDGEKEHERLGRLREATFGIQYKKPARRELSRRKATMNEPEGSVNETQ